MAAEERQSGLPPIVTLYQLGTGHYVSRALFVAAKLDVATLLKDGPRDAAGLAAATGTHAPSLRRVLRLLASVGVFAEDADGRFALTAIGDCLRADAPMSARAGVMLFAGTRTQDAWGDLEYCVRTGEPAFRKHGIADHFAEIAKDPEGAAIFDAAMADFTRMIAVAVAGAYDFGSFGTLVDVGGGNGTLMFGILRAFSTLRGVVFDQPHVVERASAAIAASGLADRCRFVGGDFFAAVPEGGDAYVLKHVIHDWDDAVATKILQTCRRAMRPDAKLLIVEGVYPPHVDQSLASRGAAANDVNMLVNTGGRQRTEAEFRALYAAAGFALTRIVPTPARVAVIEGVPS